jgi:hypothetical protein
MVGVSPMSQEAVVAIEEEDLGAAAPGGCLLGEFFGLGFRAPSGEEHER